MTKKSPRHEATPLAKPAPIAPPTPAWKLIDKLSQIDSLNVVLTFRNSDAAVLNRPVTAEQAALSMAKELPEVKRWLPMRDELARLQELARTAAGVVKTAEERFADATGDDDLTSLGYDVEAARQLLADEERNLANFKTIAFKGWEAARQAYGRFFTGEQTSLTSQAKAAYNSVAAEIVPQLCALVARLAAAKVHHNTLMRFMIPPVVNVIGEQPAAAPLVERPQEPIVLNKPWPDFSGQSELATR